MRPVALFQWVARLSDDLNSDALAGVLQPLGLDVDPDFTSQAQVVLRDRHGEPRTLDSRVTVMASIVNRARQEIQLEVRSSEPMLSRGTRCERVAASIKLLFPPLA